MSNVKINSTEVYKLFTDGGSRGNPGPAACAWIILKDNGEFVFRGSKYLGSQTNNFAEYNGLIEGLRSAIDLGIVNLKCISDSELMVKQLNGVYKVKDSNIRILFDEVQKLRKNLEIFTMSHVLRSFNKGADKLVNQCLDAN